MSEQSIERLHFFSGARLDAGQLRLEQDYHIRVRRELTRALFSPGIAIGLEVEKAPASAHHFLVGAGVAIDAMGREIILFRPERLPVRGIPSTRPGLVFGNYVVIEYREEPAGARGRACGGSLGDVGSAPSIVRQMPHISIVDALPSALSGKIVLGQLDLDPNGCSLRQVITSVRTYAAPSRQQSVRAVALAGERDIDSANGALIRFHVEGGAPARLTLHLKARVFSTLFYSELGSHTHDISLNTQNRALNYTHTHNVSGTETGPAGEHRHGYFYDGGTDGFGMDTNGSLDPAYTRDANHVQNTLFLAPDHTHSLAGLAVQQDTVDLSHNHQVTGATQARGATGPPARTGARYTEMTDLQVSYDGQPITAEVLAQLQARPGQAALWPRLGDPALAVNPLADSPDGTGPIDLVAIGVDLSPGLHDIGLTLPGTPNNGGQVLWNLYLE